MAVRTGSRILANTCLPSHAGCYIQDVIRRVGREHHGVKVITMSIHTDEGDWRGLHRFGAHGVVSKIRSLGELVQSILAIASRRSPRVDNESIQGGLAPTARQLDVLRMMAADLSLKEVAFELGFSVARVDELVAELKTRLQVRTSGGLVLRAVEMGWIEPRVAPHTGLKSSHRPSDPGR